MNVKQRIKTLREENAFSQEQMAEKLHMSASAYAKLERGETNLNLHKLEQIANIFNIDILELLHSRDNGVFVLVNEYGNNANYYGNNENQSKEIEKLQLIISHKDEIIAQKNDEITALKEIISLLKHRE